MPSMRTLCLHLMKLSYLRFVRTSFSWHVNRIFVFACLYQDFMFAWVYIRSLRLPCARTVSALRIHKDFMFAWHMHQDLCLPSIRSCVPFMRVV